jgi:Domain of unknown function (DU1801)
MQYGMIGYYVPHPRVCRGVSLRSEAATPFAGLVSRKNHMSLYLMCVYGHAPLEAWFREAWARTGKKLDMGKACVRFRKVEALALDVIGEAIRRMPVKKYLDHYEETGRLMDARTKKGPPGKKARRKLAHPSARRARKK